MSDAGDIKVIALPESNQIYHLTTFLLILGPGDFRFLVAPRANGPQRLSICHQRAVHKRKKARLF